MNTIDTDICIIGGGSGGLSVAAGAAQMGARVVLFEADRMGGDCLNSGCVPSKALLAAAKAAHHAHGNPAMGVTGAAPAIDFAAVKRHVADVIATIAPHDSVERFTGLGVQVIEERAAFAGRRLVRSASHEVRAKFFVIATGSRAAVPPVPGLDTVPFHTNETIFADAEKPAHLAIIGGGPIGIEMAQAHARLGCKVTVIEAMTILGKDDPDAAAILKDRLVKEGIELVEGIGVAGVSGTTGSIKLDLADGRSIGEPSSGRRRTARKYRRSGAGGGRHRHPPRRDRDRQAASHQRQAGLCHRRRRRARAVHPYRRLSRRHRDPQHAVPASGEDR